MGHTMKQMQREECNGRLCLGLHDANELSQAIYKAMKETKQEAMTMM